MHQESCEQVEVQIADHINCLTNDYSLHGRSLVRYPTWDFMKYPASCFGVLFQLVIPLEALVILRQGNFFVG